MINLVGIPAWLSVRAHHGCLSVCSRFGVWLTLAPVFLILQLQEKKPLGLLSIFQGYFGSKPWLQIGHKQIKLLPPTSVVGISFSIIWSTILLQKKKILNRPCRSWVLVYVCVSCVNTSHTTLSIDENHSFLFIF